MRFLAIFLAAVPYALAQFCGPDELPDKIAVNENGDVALGCRINECPRELSNQNLGTKCGNRYYELSCAGPVQWVGGIPRGSSLKNVVPLQCCSAQQLASSPVGETQKIVEPGQIFEGEVYYDKIGNVKSYDIIKNAQKIRVGDGQYAMSVTVARFFCQEEERAAQVEFAQSALGGQGFGDFAAANAFQGPLQQAAGNPLSAAGGAFGQGAAGGFGQGNFGGAFGDAAAFGAGVGDAGALGAGIAPGLDAGAGLGPALPAPAAPLPLLPGPAPALGALGAAPGGIACFTGETMVETPSGPKMMKDLRIGDQVLAVNDNEVVQFSPVTSFLHRLPEKKAEFHKISAGDSSVSLTSLHYIYTTPCDSMEPSMKYAKDVRVGECLVRINGANRVPVPVVRNEVFESTGIYNPMTDAGTIVTDGFMSSIFNVYQDANFMGTLMEFIQDVQKLIAGEHRNTNVELPWALQYVVDHASKLL